VNGKSYVGIHATDNINDGYLGCGVIINRPSSISRKCPFHNAVRKYGYAAFTKHILSFYDTYQEALEEEKYIVNKEWVKSKRNYNVAIGGNGYLLAGYDKETVSGFYRGSKNHRFGKPAHNRKKVLQYSLDGTFIKLHESVLEASESINDSPTNVTNCCKGRYGQAGCFVFRYETYSDREMDKLNGALRGRHRIYNTDGSWTMSEESRKRISISQTGRRGTIPSLESRVKMSLAKLGKKRQPHSEETKAKIGKANKIAHLKKIGGISDY